MSPHPYTAPVLLAGEGEKEGEREEGREGGIEGGREGRRDRGRKVDEGGR